MADHDLDGEPARICLRDLARVLFRHKAGAVFAFCSVLVPLGLYSLLSPEVFRSEAKLLVRPGRGSVSLDPTVATGKLMPVTQSEASLMNSELEILRSRELAASVVRALGPATFLAGAGGAMNGRTGSVEDEAVEALLDGLHVEALKDSNVVRVSYEAPSPETAQRVVTTVIAIYRDGHIGAHRTMGAHAFFARESERASQALAETEASLRDLKNTAGIGALEEQRWILMDRIASLQAQREGVAAGLSASTAKVKAMRAMLSTLPETIVTQESSGSNSAADAMRAKLYDLQLKEQDYLSKFREDSDPVREVRRQIAEAEALIEREGRASTQVTQGLSSVHQKVKQDFMAEQAALSGLTAQAGAVEVELAAANQELKALNEKEVQLAPLERQLRIQRDSYLKHAESMEQARVDDALGAERISSIGVVQPATYVSIPVGPPRLLILMAGVILGSLGGIGVVVVREFLDETLCDLKQVEERLGIRSLVAIPELPEQRAHWVPGGRHVKAAPGAILGIDAGPEEAETGQWLPGPRAMSCAESLRDDLILSADGTLGSHRTLAITSGRRGEGVSSVAAWIAASLVQSGARRVLLVDAKAIRWSDQGKHIVLPASAVSPWGQDAPCVAASYEAPSSSDLLAKLKRDDAFVVLDVPPLLESGRSLSLCALADGVILVVKAESTRWQVANEAKERLLQARGHLLGVVLNRRRYHIPGWLYRSL